jgi:hypothetical protein
MFHLQNSLKGENQEVYAAPFELLSSAKNSKGKALIELAITEAVGKDGKPRNGYVFQSIPKMGGDKIDKTRDFAVCATPAKYSDEAKHTFIITTDGNVLAKDLGKSEFIEDCPKNPFAQGWLLAE